MICVERVTRGAGGAGRSQAASAARLTTPRTAAAPTRRGRRDWREDEKPIPALAPDIASRAKATSRADWKRSSGRFSRQRLTTRHERGRGVPRLAELGRVVPQDRRHQLGGRLPSEGPRPREHLVEHWPEGEDVGTLVGRVSPDLLGRHVARRCRGPSRPRSRWTASRPLLEEPAGRAPRGAWPGRSRGS